MKFRINSIAHPDFPPPPAPQDRIAYQLPALCACPTFYPELCSAIQESAQSVKDWPGVLRQAEIHSLSPLLYHHLTAAGVDLPNPVKRELMGTSLQFARANQIRAAALAEILAALESGGIRALVLKGAALALQVYPKPGLRPMRDLDILVSPTDLTQAQALVEKLGFLPEQQPPTPVVHHHLPPLARVQQGLQVSLEIHHQLFPSTRHYHPLGYRELTSTAVAFDLHGQTGYTLDPVDMLWHIYRHAAGPPLLTIPLKWIYVADITGLVGKFTSQIDWARLKRQYPQVWRILPLIHYLTPWPPQIVERFAWDLSSPPSGIGEGYRGWPRTALDNRSDWQATFAPPEWWLRLFYGVGCGKPISYAWHRWVRHPFHLFEWSVSTALQKLRGRR